MAEIISELGACCGCGVRIKQAAVLLYPNAFRGFSGSPADANPVPKWKLQEETEAVSFPGPVASVDFRYRFSALLGRVVVEVTRWTPSESAWDQGIGNWLAVRNGYRSQGDATVTEDSDVSHQFVDTGFPGPPAWTLAITSTRRLSEPWEGALYDAAEATTFLNLLTNADWDAIPDNKAIIFDFQGGTTHDSRGTISSGSGTDPLTVDNVDNIAPSLGRFDGDWRNAGFIDDLVATIGPDAASLTQICGPFADGADPGRHDNATHGGGPAYSGLAVRTKYYGLDSLCVVSFDQTSVQQCQDYKPTPRSCRKVTLTNGFLIEPGFPGVDWGAVFSRPACCPP